MIAIFTVVTYVPQKEISERHREKDARLAHLTRQKDIDLALSQRVEDQRQADDLHYQTAFANYIEDISNSLYKQPHNQSIFCNEESKILYIRRKTLITLREIDSERKSQLSIFLYENNLLLNRFSSYSGISLAGADLHGVIIENSITGTYTFFWLKAGI
ncbi:unnamed protein product, partial [Rotaria sp. Silwood1]